jgi:hypothetical protein
VTDFVLIYESLSSRFCVLLRMLWTVTDLRMNHEWLLMYKWTRSESYVTTDSQLASLSCNKAPMWDLRPDFYYCQTVVRLLMWGALSDQRTGLSFTIAAGLHQRSRSRVWVLWDPRPYFSVSDSRLSFSSPPTTRRVTVEVFDPATTQDECILIWMIA